MSFNLSVDHHSPINNWNMSNLKKTKATFHDFTFAYKLENLLYKCDVVFDKI